MSQSSLTSAVHEAFAQRCAQLQIPVWLCDPNGAVVSGPAIVSQTQIAELLASTASRSEPLPMSGGRHLLVLEEKRGAQILSLSVALLQQSDSCGQVATMLRWIHEDLVRNRRDQQTLGEFSERLAQSYEENQMLLGLSRALNRDAGPAEIIRSICDGLMQILPFGWVGIRFGQDDQQVPGLSGALVLARASSPCDLAALEQEVGAILGGDLNRLPRLQPPDSSDITRLVGSEVVAEPILHDDVPIALLLAGNKGGDDPGVQSFETQFISAAAGFLGILHENIARFAEQQTLFLGTLKALTASIDAKDHYTRGHSERVAHLAWLMARAMKLDVATVEDYRIAGMVHDVGKIGVPEAILCKPGRPTDEEFAKIRRHPEIGHEILRDIPELHKALSPRCCIITNGGMVWDIRMAWRARVHSDGGAGDGCAMADAFDAMSSTRSYRPALTRDKVLTEVLHCAGGQFDPDLVPIFVRLDFRGFDTLVEKHCASERFAA